MKRNWKETWANCSPEELDGIAVLRVMECTNGIIQHLFRDGAPEALSVDETRVAMKFSMSSVKDQSDAADGPFADPRFHQGGRGQPGLCAQGRECRRAGNGAGRRDRSRFAKAHAGAARYHHP